jgi:hypothetical protein
MTVRVDLSPMRVRGRGPRGIQEHPADLAPGPDLLAVVDLQLHRTIRARRLHQSRPR